MRVLITGGAGFIGRHLAEALAGHDLVALDNLHPQVHLDPEGSRRSFPGVVRTGDVAEPQDWRDTLRASRPLDAIVHLAAETGTGQSMYQQERYHRTNVNGTRLAAAAAEDSGTPLVVLSSRAVYGEGRYDCGQHGPVLGPACCGLAGPAPSRETDPHQPVSVYGETKSLAERALQGLSTPVSVLRPQNVVGTGQALHNPYTGVLAAFLACLREGKPLTVYGDGSQTRDFVHVSDVVALIRWSIEQPPAAHGPRVLNCGTGTSTTLLQLAQCAAAGSPSGRADIEHKAVHRSGDILHACADLSQLRAAGAPLPVWSSQDAVVEFIRGSWDQPGAGSGVWDAALDELAVRGLVQPPPS